MDLILDINFPFMQKGNAVRSLELATKFHGTRQLIHKYIEQKQKMLTTDYKKYTENSLQSVIAA